MIPARVLSRGLSAYAIAAVAGLSACSLDVSRDRLNRPLDIDAFSQLEVGRSNFAECLESLGAPDKLEWKDGKDHLWWFHGDSTAASVRFQIPFSIAGYRHNVFQYLQSADQLNSLYLVFDEADLLAEKSLTLPEVFRAEVEEEGRGRVHVSTRLEQSFFIAGDADVADFSDIFAQGQVAGVEVGFQPAAPLTLAVGGRFGQHDGETIRRRGSRIEFGGLDVFAGEALVRLQLPFWAFERVFDFDHLRRVVFADNPASHDGWLLFVEAGAGLAYNTDVGVRVDGQSRGDFFDSGVGFTSSGTSGIEYSTPNISMRIALSFRALDGFDAGESGLPDDASSFQTWLLGAQLAVKF